jgi:glycosyltransferase involved in cell wall biosynthesis
MRDNCFNLILLSGWHVNKNIDRLLAVARNLKTSGKNDVVFNLSLSLHDPEVNFFFQAISEEGLNKYFNFLGRVSPTDVQFLIRKGNAVLLISTLESFSNNIIEAWAYSRPLIITDAGWSRGACQDAALYVDIGSPQSIAQGIINISENERLSKGLVSLGKERLKVFPSPREKVDQHLKMLQDVYLL